MYDSTPTHDASMVLHGRHGRQHRSGLRPPTSRDTSRYAEPRRQGNRAVKEALRHSQPRIGRAATSNTSVILVRSHPHLDPHLDSHAYQYDDLKCRGRRWIIGNRIWCPAGTSRIAPHGPHCFGTMFAAGERARVRWRWRPQDDRLVFGTRGTQLRSRSRSRSSSQAQTLGCDFDMPQIRLVVRGRRAIRVPAQESARCPTSPSPRRPVTVGRSEPPRGTASRGASCARDVSRVDRVLMSVAVRGQDWRGTNRMILQVTVFRDANTEAGWYKG